jgi:hypothetical protein
MKRKGSVVGALLILALYAMAGPAGAAGRWGGEEFAGGQGLWAMLWQRAVCFVGGSWVDSNGLSSASGREAGIRSIFAEHGMCVDPNGGPSPKACAEIQTLEPRVSRDR